MTTTLHRSAINDATRAHAQGTFTDYLTTLRERWAGVEPHIHAFIPDDQRETHWKDAANAVTAGALAGVPVGIKDIFHVDGYTTHAGTALPPKLFAGEQAAVVNKLIAAGAWIAGKTVTTEFAFFEPGPTRNPHNVAHTPGGSSSGSAAAVAAGLVPLAVGTQTVGSVIRPAAYCGVVGFKPSYGRIDSDGVVYVSPSLDHVGLFTQDVSGMQAAAAVVCNDWEPQPGDASRPVLGIPDGAYLEQAEPEGFTAFVAQIKRLENAGYTVKRVRVLDDIETLAKGHFDLMAYEMAAIHAAWLADHEAQYRPRTLDLIRRGQGVSAAAADAARTARLDLRERFHDLMAREGIDLWISPPAPGTAPAGIGATGDPRMNLPWTNAGLPTITLPAGAVNALPVGLQLAARFGHDEALLAWGAALSPHLQPAASDNAPS